jgi:hypothetical protein
MLVIPAALVRQFRTVCRQGLWGRASAAGSRALVVFQGGPDGLLVHCQQQGSAVAFRQPGSFPAEVLTLTANVLQEVEGSTTPVELEGVAGGQVLVRWQDGQVPRVQQCPDLDPASLPELPAEPRDMQPVGVKFLAALDEAVRTSAEEPVRYALGCVQLRGAGTLAATDGKQLLLQGGFRFPWSEDLLVGRSRAVGCAAVRQQHDVALGRTEDHALVRAGPWSVFLAVDKDGRFPRVEEIIPSLTGEFTHWQVAAEEAEFLRRSLAKLPGGDDPEAPVTLDLGAAVAVRARAAGQERGTELVLAGSKVEGKPVRLGSNRRYLARALELGCREFAIVKADVPVQAWIGERRYVWMPLDKDAALAPSEHDLRLRAAADRPRPANATPARKAAPPAVPQQNGHAAAPTRCTARAAKGAGEGNAEALLAEAQAVRELLRQALTRTGALLQAVRRQKKERRLMRATLTSLRQLQQTSDFFGGQHPGRGKH